MHATFEGIILIVCGLAANHVANRLRVPQDRSERELLRVVDEEGLGTRARAPVGGAIASMLGACGELGDVVHRMRGHAFKGFHNLGTTVERLLRRAS